jgi:hypothetical protein
MRDYPAFTVPRPNILITWLLGIARMCDVERLEDEGFWFRATIPANRGDKALSRDSYPFCLR